MFKIYKRGNGKIWQISYKVCGKVFRETTKTDLFCNAVLLCKKIEKQIPALKAKSEHEDRIKKVKAEKYMLAEKILNERKVSINSIDGFDDFYLDASKTPACCSYELGVVYIIKSGDAIKIGITKEPRKRLRSIETGTGKKIEAIYLSRQCKNFREAEILAHEMFADQRGLGEWFDIDFRCAVYCFQDLSLDTLRTVDINELSEVICSHSTT